MAGVLFTTDAEWEFARPGWQIVHIEQPDDDRRVMAAAQHLIGYREPVALGGHRDMGRLLPRLGFARRAARLPVVEYLLVDSDLPAVAGDWPDAPVRFIATGEKFATHAKVASQRGWQVEVS